MEYIIHKATKTECSIKIKPIIKIPLLFWCDMSGGLVVDI